MIKVVNEQTPTTVRGSRRMGKHEIGNNHFHIMCMIETSYKSQQLHCSVHTNWIRDMRMVKVGQGAPGHGSLLICVYYCGHMNCGICHML